MSVSAGSAVAGAVEAVVRVLIVVRLSSLTEETTSPERQLEVCRAYVSRHPGWVEVDVAEDLDVSASTVPPFERPALRGWLHDRHYEYDVILVWRADRLIRSMFDFVDLYRWGDKTRTHFISATESHFDTRTEMGQAMGIQAAMFAEWEAKAIRQRTKESYEKLVKSGRWRGGQVPWEYRPVPKDGGGWGLEIEPTTAATIREITDRIIGGERPNTVIVDMNRKKVLTPRDEQRVLLGKEPKGYTWVSGNLSRALRSPTLLGYAVKWDSYENGKKKRLDPPEVIRGDDAKPVQRAAPILDRDTYDQLQKQLDSNNGKRGSYVKSNSLLLRVLFCGVCGRPMYRSRGRNLFSYRCPSISSGVGCGNRAVRENFMDDFAEVALLRVFGDHGMMTKEFDPGSDNAAELAEIDAELTDLVDLVGTAAYRSGPAKVRLNERIEKLGERREALEKEDVRPAGYVMVPTGQTVGEYFCKLDKLEKNAYFRRVNLRIEWRRTDDTDGVEVSFGWGDLVAATVTAQGGGPREVERVHAAMAAGGIEVLHPCPESISG